MKKLSISEIANLVGSTRETVTKRLEGVPFTVEKGNAKLFDSSKVLRLLPENTGPQPSAISEQESRIRLNLLRAQQIEVETEVTRKERIPLEDVTAINEEAFSNMAGILKASEGKVLTAELIRDIFAQTREIGNKIKEWATE